jgi:hypothetical protein
MFADRLAELIQTRVHRPAMVAAAAVDTAVGLLCEGGRAA